MHVELSIVLLQDNRLMYLHVGNYPQYVLACLEFGLAALGAFSVVRELLSMILQPVVLPTNSSYQP